MEIYSGWLDADETIEVLAVLEQIADSTGATIQAFDARYVVGPGHLEHAVQLADRAIEHDRAIADDRGVEILLYAAGRRQINRAMRMGLKGEDHAVVIVIDGGDHVAASQEVAALFRELTPFDGSLADEEYICDFFNIPDRERSTGARLADLVIERVTLLTIDG